MSEEPTKKNSIPDFAQPAPIESAIPIGPDKASFEAYQMARERYVVDPVTGTLNRAGFLEEATKTLGKSKNPENIAIIILDLDRFKPLNDSQGHGTGDLALRGTAEFLEEELRQSDLVAHARGRMGGDEFIVLADLTPRQEGPGQSKEERLAILLDRISNNYGESMARKNELFGRLSLSAGGAFYEPGMPIEETIKKADEQMYLKKQAAGGESR
jgi:diguanylate cyclase (GGDEF)-like protein